MPRILPVAVSAMFLLPLWAGAQTYSFDEKVLTIATDRYEVRWKDGSVISWKTQLPGERELMTPKARYAPGQLPNGPSSRPRNLPPPFEYQPWAAMEPERVEWRINPSIDYHTTVSFERTEEGARLVYGKLGADRDLSWVQEFSVDPATGDLCIRQKATSPKGNLSGVSFGIYNLDATLPLAVPAFPGNGQVWREDHGKGKILNIGYPRFWSAGLIIGMIPGGGSFAVWSEDPHFRPKYFRNFSDGERRNIGFEAALDYPYENNREIEVFTWRLNTFSGNWTEPAARYRDLLVRLHSLKPLAKRTPAWMNSLSMVWSTTEGSAEQAEAMQAKLDPGKIVLWDFTGSTRLNGLNLRVPEYIPREGFAERNERLREAGFHVASYYSMALVDAQAHPTMIRDYGLGLYYDALGREEASGIGDQRLVYVHPGSARWRRFYAEKMREVFDNYHVDLLYQDVAGTAVGSSGRVEGLNFNEAVVAADAATHHAVPEAMIGGEYWNEVTIVHESIGLQRSVGWGGDATRNQMSRMEMPHPICSFLFSPFSHYIGYKVPQRDRVIWHQDQNMNEVIGSLPNWRTPVTDQSPEAEITLLRARLWAEGFKPWFPAEWEEGVASYLRNPAGDVVRYRRHASQSYCTREDQGGAERLVYARVSGVSRVSHSEPVQIRNWVAYDARGPIGLDPGQYYCLFPGKPPASPVVIDQVPKSVSITSFRQAADYLLVSFNGPVDGNPAFRWHADIPGWTFSVRDLNGAGCLLGVHAKPEKAAPEQEFAPGEFTFLMTLGGMPIEVLETVPHRQVRLEGAVSDAVQLLPPGGGRDSEIVMEKLVTLPKTDDLGLLFSTDRRGGAGDGIHLVVRANGQEIWRQYSGTEPEQKTHAIPLAPFAGQAVLLTIGVDAGKSGYNSSNDEVRIGRIRLGRVEPGTAPGEPPRETEAAPPTPEDETYR
ncbi:MAG TPA: DUF6259 domain-containing protein [Chthoniobacteraceae bacterium]|nr:DUF6259 domain-containing protein [Chthoniobacteraceae bacterium]